MHRIAATRWPRRPTTGAAGVCAVAISGHAIDVLPTRLMNSHRFNVAPQNTGNDIAIIRC